MKKEARNACLVHLPSAKKIGEISPTKDYIIIATYQKGKLVIPQTDSVISRGEKVTVLVKRGAFKKVAKKLEK